MHKIVQMNENLKLSNQLCFPIYCLSKEIISAYRPFLEAMDITYSQYLVLIVLWEFEQLSVKEIGEKLDLDSGTLTPLLKRLETKNIVTRNRSTEDERMVLIALTSKGIELREKATCIPQQLMNQVQLTNEEQTQLKTIINKILQNLK